MEAQASKELHVPLALLFGGVLLFAFAAYRVAGSDGAGAVLPPLAMSTAVGVALMLVGAFITAKLIGVSFGSLPSACMKLAAVYIFPSAVGAAVNVAGLSWLISIVLYLGLLVYLFEFELKEAMIFAGVMIVIKLVVSYLIVVQDLR
jgi:hypothetical protein